MTNIPNRLRKIALISCCGFVFLLFGPIPARSQFVGYTSPQTVNQTFTFNCDGAVHSATVPNAGQSVHFLGYQANAQPFNLRVYLTTPSVGVGTIQISDTGSDYNGGILTANGYYSQVQVNAQCAQIIAGTTVTLNYFGTSANAVPVTGLSDQSAWFKPIALSANLTTNPAFLNIIAPYGNSCGQIIVNSSGSAPTGTLTVTATDNNVGNRTLATFALISSTSNQTYNVPCVPTTNLTLSVSSGGGSANVFYFFYKPGLFPNLTTPNSGTSATLPIQVVSDSLSSAFGETSSAANPGSASLLASIAANNGANSIYFDKLIISSTAAATVQIDLFGNCTGTCSGFGNVVNLKAGSSVTSSAGVSFSATNGASSTNNTVSIPVAANTPVTIDLRGYILPAGTNASLALFNATAITGNLSTALQWYEHK